MELTIIISFLSNPLNKSTKKRYINKKENERISIEINPLPMNFLMNMIKMIGIIEAKTTLISFVLNGITPAYFLDWKKSRKLYNDSESIVAMAAPFNPFEFSREIIFGRGIRMKSKIILKIFTKIRSIKIIFDLPVIDTRLFETSAIENNSAPIAKNLKGFAEIRYSFPKSTLMTA